MEDRMTTGRRPAGSWRVAAAVAAALASGFATQSVHAQQAAADELGEVTVTGSRIVRRDLDAASPIVTVSEDTFENTSAVSVEAALNELPQFKPDRTQFVAGDVQASAFNTPGISSVNLRGLGSNRNLVLLDGRRAQPANATLTVDVNSIPAAAIANVEVISGGASATYGADAIAGVVNFKLKRDFQGLVVDLQSGITEQGDGDETRLSGLIGGNFGDGRGNVMVGLELARRGSVMERDRDFFVAGFNDPQTTGSPLSSFASYNPAGPNGPSQAAVNSVFGTTPGAAART
ncbi:MAG: TonB-dependent receptor, partial [Proteobacteria bacterium]